MGLWLKIGFYLAILASSDGLAKILQLKNLAVLFLT
jgi:hypothetical protein